MDPHFVLASRNAGSLTPNHTCREQFVKKYDKRDKPSRTECRYPLRTTLCPSQRKAPLMLLKPAVIACAVLASCGLLAPAATAATPTPAPAGQRAVDMLRIPNMTAAAHSAWTLRVKAGKQHAGRLAVIEELPHGKHATPLEMDAGVVGKDGTVTFTGQLAGPGMHTGQVRILKSGATTATSHPFTVTVKPGKTASATPARITASSRVTNGAAGATTRPLPPAPGARPTAGARPTLGTRPTTGYATGRPSSYRPLPLGAGVTNQQGASEPSGRDAGITFTDATTAGGVTSDPYEASWTPEMLDGQWAQVAAAIPPNQSTALATINKNSDAFFTAIRAGVDPSTATSEGSMLTLLTKAAYPSTADTSPIDGATAATLTANATDLTGIGAQLDALAGNVNTLAGIPACAAATSQANNDVAAIQGVHAQYVSMLSATWVNANLRGGTTPSQDLGTLGGTLFGTGSGSPTFLSGLNRTQQAVTHLDSLLTGPNGLIASCADAASARAAANYHLVRNQTGATVLGAADQAYFNALQSLTEYYTGWATLGQAYAGIGTQWAAALTATPIPGSYQALAALCKNAAPVAGSTLTCSGLLGNQAVTEGSVLAAWNATGASWEQVTHGLVSTNTTANPHTSMLEPATRAWITDLATYGGKNGGPWLGLAFQPAASSDLNDVIATNRFVSTCQTFAAPSGCPLNSANGTYLRSAGLFNNGQAPRDLVLATPDGQTLDTNRTGTAGQSATQPGTTGTAWPVLHLDTTPPCSTVTSFTQGLAGTAGVTNVCTENWQAYAATRWGLDFGNIALIPGQDDTLTPTGNTIATAWIINDTGSPQTLTFTGASLDDTVNFGTSITANDTSPQHITVNGCTDDTAFPIPTVGFGHQNIVCAITAAPGITLLNVPIGFTLGDNSARILLAVTSPTAASAAIITTTTQPTPGATPGPITGLHATFDTSAARPTVALAFTPPAAALTPISGYQVTLTDPNRRVTTLTVQADRNGTQATINVPLPANPDNGIWQVTVTAASTNGTGPTATVNVTFGSTAPQPVTGLTGTIEADGTLRLQWDPSSATPAVTGYTVAQTNPDGTVATPGHVTGPAYTTGAITETGVYQFTVIATNTMGSSAPARTSVKVTGTVPRKVTGLATQLSGDGLISVAWNGADATPVVTSYNLAVYGPTPNGAAILTQDFTVASANSTVNIPNVFQLGSDSAPGMYTVVITGSNATGMGPAVTSSLYVSPATINHATLARVQQQIIGSLPASFQALAAGQCQAGLWQTGYTVFGSCDEVTRVFMSAPGLPDITIPDPLPTQGASTTTPVTPTGSTTVGEKFTSKSGTFTRAGQTVAWKFTTTTRCTQVSTGIPRTRCPVIEAVTGDANGANLHITVRNVEGTATAIELAQVAGTTLESRAVTPALADSQRTTLDTAFSDWLPDATGTVTRTWALTGSDVQARGTLTITVS